MVTVNNASVTIPLARVMYQNVVEFTRYYLRAIHPT
jgi:hypothetical protein